MKTYTFKDLHRWTKRKHIEEGAFPNTVCKIEGPKKGGEVRLGRCPTRHSPFALRHLVVGIYYQVWRFEFQFYGSRRRRFCSV